MSDVLFSVIIPTYNGMESLAIALQSLCNQTYKNIEVIVSDDNGKDTNGQIETQKIIAKFSSKLNLKYLINEHVNGSHARNKGLEVAKGEYIAFLDDDDFYLEDYVRKAVETFAENKEMDLIFFNVAFISREGVARIVENDNIAAMDLLFGKKEIGTGSNLCFRRRVVDNQHFFDDRYLRYQDIEFAVKKLSFYKSMWIKELEIVKYFNVNENYLNYNKALKMQKLLREDMLCQGIINETQAKELQSKQLHTLYRDMLVKNMDKKDITIVYEMLKNDGLALIVDKLMYVVYLVSPFIFNLVYKIVLNSNNKQGNDVAPKLLDKRERLKEQTI